MLLERLDTAALLQAYVDAVMPRDLAPDDEARSRERAEEFAAVVLRQAFGDDSALPVVEEMVRTAAVDSLRGGQGPGPGSERVQQGPGAGDRVPDVAR